MKELSPELKQAIINDVAVRKALVYENHEAFCRIYLQRHITYEFAWFHKEMFRITEEYQHKLNVFMAFRGSGKSTILNLSNALWSILGKHQKKFVVIMSKTRVQSQSHFNSIKQELEENELLKNDLGPFQASKEDWGAFTIEIPKYGAKIMCIGAMQNIRGLKYRNHRPDLIICDDMEDMTSFQDGKQIRLFHDWFMGEIWSIGSEKTNIVVLGNLLHPSSIMITLYKGIKHGEMPGLFKAYPLLDDRNRILWPQRYPDAKAIKDLEKSVPGTDRFGLYTIFSREYLLDMSTVSVDYYMEEKHDESIRPGGDKVSDFEISAPMWAHGQIWYIPGQDDGHCDFSMSLDDEDGYNSQPWKHVEEAFKEMMILKNPANANKYKPPEKIENIAYENMKDYPDLPIRYRCWYRYNRPKELKPSEFEKIGKKFGDEYRKVSEEIRKGIRKPPENKPQSFGI